MFAEWYASRDYRKKSIAASEGHHHASSLTSTLGFFCELTCAGDALAKARSPRLSHETRPDIKAWQLQRRRRFNTALSTFPTVSMRFHVLLFSCLAHLLLEDGRKQPHVQEVETARASVLVCACVSNCAPLLAATFHQLGQDALLANLVRRGRDKRQPALNLFSRDE